MCRYVKYCIVNAFLYPKQENKFGFMKMWEQWNSSQGTVPWYVHHIANVLSPVILENSRQPINLPTTVATDTLKLALTLNSFNKQSLIFI